METIIYKPLNQIWLKASVIGSFWASVEIILGSFLHNLKVPFSGTILSFISVYLLVSFLQIWKENGLIIRAGLVCALMKSISPSAIIIGPMIGILTEAAILELFVLLLGKNIFGYITGGALAVFSTLLHKAGSLLILYGLDFIRILNALYQFAAKQIKAINSDPLSLLIFLALIYLITGTLAATAGYFTGKKYIRSGRTGPETSEIKLETANKLFSETTKQKYSVYYLIINIIAIVVSLVLINNEIPVLSVFFPVSYFIFCIFRYRSSLNRLKKISVWIQFAIITIAASFLWNGISAGNFFAPDGLITGLKMIARAIIIITGFAVISTELKNPLIKSILYRKGFANLYQSVSLAFSALPGIISGINESKKTSKTSGISFSRILSQAEYLLPQFEKEHFNKPSVILITGDIHQGKTTFTGKLISNLKRNNLSIGGFLAPALFTGNKHSGFKLFDIATSEEYELCTDAKKEGWQNYGKYYFNPEGLKRGNEILIPQNLEDKELVIIDEIGPLEINDKGWSSSIENLCSESSVTQLWIVRRGLIDRVIRKWNVGDIYIFDISIDTLNDAENEIIKIVSPPDTLPPAP